jgi:tetratricopeptide (TPR) repeat protein
LIDNAADPDARALRDKAMQAKSGAEEAKAQEAAQAEVTGQKAIAQSLDKLGQKLKTAPSGASASASQAASAGQGSGADVQAKAKAATAAAAASAKAEADAQKKAEADAEAARAKAEAEELAKKSRDLQDKMRAVNDLVEKGKASIDSGDFSGGERLFAEARDRLPEGEDKFAGQKLADIADSLYTAAKKNPGPDADSALQEAIQTARDAKKRDASNALPYYTLGKINSDLNQTDNAIIELRQAASLDPKNYLYSYALGLSYFKARRYEDARQSFEATTTLNPKFERGYYNLGMTWKAMGDQGKALDIFRKAVQVKPDYAVAWQQIGFIQAARGDRKSATDSYGKAIQFDPGNAQAMRELAVIQADSGDYKSAEGLFQRALGVKDDALTNYNMATVKLELGKAQDAVKYAEKAVAQSSNVAIYQYALGLADEQAGNSDAAIAAYTQAAALDKK